jgi:hypothetical protein
MTNDPESKEPDFKFSAVIDHTGRQNNDHVIGAGAGACGFVKVTGL